VPRVCSNVDDYMKRCGTLWVRSDERKATNRLLIESLLDSIMAYDMPLKAGDALMKPILVRSTQFPPTR
jgi:hypothetical protein